MKHWIPVACMICALASMLLVAPPAAADTWNKKTVVTTSGPLEVPGGVVLDAGKYVFKLADSASNRHIVQVFNERENRIYATILAIPKYRQQPTGDTVITTWETPMGQPPAIRSWFYPGDQYGQEFAYPKRRAAEISRTAGETVPALTATETAREPDAAPSDAAPSAEQNPRVGKDEIAAAQPERDNADKAEAGETEKEEPTLLAQNRPQTPPDAQPTPPAAGETPSELPQTSGALVVFAVLGLVALSGAAVLAFAGARR